MVMGLRCLREQISALGVSGKKLAILDDDRDITDVFSRIYCSIGLVSSSYVYPVDMSKFWDKAKEYDFILVDHMLGGTNGANVAANLLKNREVRAKIFIISAAFNQDYSSFKYYFKKSSLIDNPCAIFSVDDNIIDRAVETSVLRQMRVENACQS